MNVILIIEYINFFKNIQFLYLTKYILNFDFTQINKNIDLNENV